MKTTEKNFISQTEFFGWKRHPFVDSASDSEPFMTSQEENILNMTNELLKMGKSLAITGASGVGKSTLMRKIVQSLDSCLYKSILVSYGGLNRASLLKAIATICNLDLAKKGLPPLLRIQQYMIKLSQEQTPIFPVLIIDDAQWLEQDSFMDLCSLLMDPKQNRAAMSLILAGDESLAVRLKLNIMRPIRSRLSCLMKCDPINEKDSIEFVQARLIQAKAPKDLISQEAINLIVAQCHGNKREIMNAGAVLLSEAMFRGDKTIGPQQVINSMLWEKSG
ncbi:MAG: AAA family ATPase [Candidatus Riflebacteria bacterium]|nr:AAA family ATPase [Candidatus Riflebacteria bacterium]